MAYEIVKFTDDAGSSIQITPQDVRQTFCQNATDALNTAIHGTVRTGDHVIATLLEHNSVLRPLYELEKRGTISFSVAETFERDVRSQLYPIPFHELKRRLAMHEKYTLKHRQLKKEYEENYGPLSPKSGEGIEWLKNPWPWDIGGDCWCGYMRKSCSIL